MTAVSVEPQDVWLGIEEALQRGVPGVRPAASSGVIAPAIDTRKAMRPVIGVIEQTRPAPHPANAGPTPSLRRGRAAEEPRRPHPAEAVPARRTELPQLRSEEYREVVGAPPQFLVRSGSIIAGIAVATLLIVACIVPYPSSVGGRVHVVSTELPVTLVSRGTGKIGLLSVRDGQQVARDDILAVLDDGSDFIHMLDLDRWLLGVPADLSEGHTLPAFPDLPPAGLGPATAPMLLVRQSLAELTSFRASTATADQVAQLRRVVDSYSRLGEQFRDKENAADASLQAEQRMQAGRETLVARGLAANAYLDKFESGKQSQRERVADAHIASARNLATIATTEREISGLLATHHDRDIELTGRLGAALRDLRGVMMEWERVNVIRAAQAGRARLFAVWSESQNLRAGDTFAIIEPINSAPTAFAFVPAAGFGKVRLGQRVSIRLDAYPYHEFGLVEARVAAVSAVAVDGQYRVLLDLPNGLRLSSRRNVEFSQNMEGDARIDVDHLRLIQQLLPGLLAPEG
jgi:HlyD family secretion protein